MKVENLFITFEGIDGSGKSVQAHLLLENLRKKGFSTVLVRDPGTTSVSEKIREILLHTEKGSVNRLTELMLYEAARAQLVAQEIMPALAKREIVISDRFTDSTVAYQGFGRKVDIDIVNTANKLVCGLLKPIITFILDITPKESLRRRRDSCQIDDRIEKEKEEFFNSVREGYRIISKEESDRVVLLDGTLSIQKLEQIILKNVLKIVLF